MKTTYLTMKSLIEKKYYHTLDEVLSYLDLFVMISRLKQKEYEELVSLANERYGMSELETVISVSER